MANMDPQRPQVGELPTFGNDINGEGASVAINSGSAGDTAASSFGELANRLGGWADTAAKDEGTRAGKIAGLDPNYRPTDDETTYGRAFNQNATTTYTNSVEAQARQSISDAYAQYMNLPQDQRQPAVLQKNLQSIQQDFISNHVFQEIQGAFQSSFSSLSQTYLKGAQDDFEKRTADQAKASLVQNANAAADTAHRIASIPGPDADAQLQTQVDGYNKLLDERVNNDAITATQAAKMKDDFRQGVLRTRVLTQFNNAPDKAAFAQNFQKAYGSGGNSDAEQQAMAFFQSKGWSKEQAAGLVGNLIHESGLKTTATNEGDGEDGSDSIGIGQWNGDRAAALKAFAAARGTSANDFGTQLEFVQHELETTHADAGKALRSAGDANSAAAAVALKYEKPAGSETGVAGNVNGWADRSAQAQRLAGQSGGNPTANLSPETFAYLNGAMRSQLRADATQQNQQQRAALNDIDAAQKQVASGYDVPEAQWSQLRQQYGASADPKVRDAFETADGIRTMLVNFRGQTPTAIASAIAHAQATDASGYTPRQMASLQAAQSYLGKLRADLASDPIGRGARDGVVQPAPIDPTNPTGLAQSLSARIPVAEATAAHYGLAAPTYLRPDERAAFKSLAAQGGPAMVQAAGALAATLGSRTDAVLKEIGGDAPKFAALARVAAWNGDQGFLADVAERQRLVNDPTARGSLELPTPAAADPVFANTYGDAMSLIPGMAASSRGLAKDAFEVRALRDNLDKKLSTSAAVDALGKAAQQAAGATYDGDTQYGGVATYKPGFWSSNQKILAPLDMRADGVARAVGTLTDADLKALPAPPVAGDGKTPIAASTIQGANLKSVGHGQYYVALGDPSGKDPRWVMTPDGQKFTLDLNALRPAIAARAPDLYRSGS